MDFSERLHVSLGLRTDDHSSFGAETTYNLAPVYTLAGSGTKLRAAYGTGFKAPTLFQLFSSYGDPTLDPERSRGWEAGFDQKIAEGTADLGVTYFVNEFDNLIDFDSATSTYKNLGAVRTKGVELMTSYRPTDSLKLAFNYTFTDSEDDAGQPLVRRPDNKAAFDLNRDFGSSGSVDLEVVYVGKRDDYDFSTFPTTRVELGAYTLVNASATVELGEKITLTGRIENLFDEDYEEVLGYGTFGVSAYVGVKAEL
jgi:vitamin B12 transporter